MTQAQLSQLTAYLWGIANDQLVDVFEPTDYRKVIMPMLTLRRIDVLLKGTHDKVLERMKQLEGKVQNIAPILKQESGYPFYNTSEFTMDSFRNETNSQNLKKNFRTYLNGFSEEVLDIINKYELFSIADKLVDNNRMSGIIEKFTSPDINLGIDPIMEDDNKTEKLPGLDNHSMGLLFEHLLRQFNETYSVTSAGRHFTPRDYVALLADVAILPIADKIPDTTLSIYDGACGTGGILSVAKQRVEEIAQNKSKSIKINLFGQELMPETFATCKSEMLMTSKFRENNAQIKDIQFGSTISNDGHPGKTFDFCISNPPFGTSWKEDLRQFGDGVEIKKDEITDTRFVTVYDGNSNYRMLPDIGDPQMLFLANNISRMKKDTPLGTRIVEIHNGSSLFTGSAGQGESNLRRYIIENDWLEAIIAMPENMFYNTGIGTYIWVLTNKKETRRKGKVQLIDATAIKTPLRKNLGEKNCDANEQDRMRIVKLLTDFAETPQSKIFDNNEFGYWQITVERPLRLQVKENSLQNIELIKAKASLKKDILKLWEEIEPKFNKLDWNSFAKELVKLKDMTASLLTKIKNAVTEINPEAEPVLADFFDDECTAYEADSNLRDSEQVPLKYKGGIEEFMKKEVLPYSPDAFVGETKIGYELSFTKYFYKPVQLRSVDTIMSEIMTIENETNGMLDLIMK